MIGETHKSHARPVASVAVDLAIFTVRHGELQVLLIERGKEPFRGQPALPGGYVPYGEARNRPPCGN